MLIHRNVTAVEHQVRPKGLGLGADRSLIKDLEPSKHKQPPKPGDERVKEEELVMGPGSCVLVESGPHKDKYGKVELTRVEFLLGRTCQCGTSSACINSLLTKSLLRGRLRVFIQTMLVWW